MGDKTEDDIDMVEPALAPSWSFPKPKLQHYTGTAGEDVNVWVAQVSQLLATDKTLDNEEKKFDAATAWIGGQAHYFLVSYQGARSWEVFCKALISAKDPNGGSLRATGDLFRLHQKGSLRDYFEECMRVFPKVSEPAPMSVAEQLRWFLRGLAAPYEEHAFMVLKSAENYGEAFAMLLLRVPEPPRLTLISSEMKKRTDVRQGTVQISLGIVGGNGLLYVEGRIVGNTVRCLVDSGASHNFISPSLLPRSFPITGTGGSVNLADGSSKNCAGPVQLAVSVQGRELVSSFLIMSSTFDVILGLPWLSQAKPVIDWTLRTLKIAVDADVKERTAPRMALNAMETEILLNSDIEDIEDIYVMSIVESSGQEQHPAVAGLLKEFSGVFPDALPMELPPERGSTFKIILKPDARPRVRPMKRFSHKDLESLQSEVEGLLKAGLIKPSESEFGAQVLFVNKKDGTRRMCIDYHSLNADTVRDVYPLPLIDEIFDKLAGARIFSKLDLRSGYHQQLVAPEDTFKTAFRTPMGTFEFLVLPFGLTNAPAGFVRMINKVFPHTEFGKFMVPYLDDLLVYSVTMKDHVGHLRAVLGRLAEAKLYAKMSVHICCF
jgi:hypothetical protein